MYRSSRQKLEMILPSMGDINQIEVNFEREEKTHGEKRTLQQQSLSNHGIIESEDDERAIKKESQRKHLSFESLNKIINKNQDKWKTFNFTMMTGRFLRLFLVDLLKLLFHSRKCILKNKELKLEDIPHLEPEEQTRNREQDKVDREEKDLGAWNMLITLVKTFSSELTVEFAILCLMNGVKLYSSIAIRNLIESISNNEELSTILMWAFIIAIANLLYVILMHHANKINYCLFSKIRVMFMKSLYLKVSSLSAFTVKEANLGKLINLVSGDLSTVESMSYLIMCLTIIPFCLVFVAVILYGRFGWIGVFGLLLMICFIPIQILVANLSSKLFAEKTDLVDERVNFTSELIEGIRLIKLYAWESAFSKSISAIRQLELRKILFKFSFFFIEHSISLSTGILGCYFIFTLTLSYGSEENLSLGNMFATLDLLQYTRVAMITYAGYGLSGIFELKVILQRMASIFKIKSAQMRCIKGQNLYENAELEQGEVKMKNFFAYWKEESQPILKNINLEIKSGECIAIVGKIGSGKSTLLNCILKEIPKYQGSFAYKGKLAYVEQEPYIFSSTIRENILFGKKYEESFYNEVVKVCNLQDDFKLFVNGDSTEIGEKGTNLSGGQKSRISLARALYSQADIYLLDDPLSAVDAKVANSLFNGAIKRFLSDRTVILVTHQIHFTKGVDRIYILEEGSIQVEGTYKEIQVHLQELSNQSSQSSSDNDSSTDSSNGSSSGDSQNNIQDFENSIIFEEEQNSSEDSNLGNTSNSNNMNADPQLKNQNKGVSINSDDEKKNEESSKNGSSQEETQKQLQSDQEKQQLQEGEDEENKKCKLFTNEASENTKVTLQTYLEYIKQSNSLKWIPLILVFFFSSEVLNILYTTFIGYYNNSSSYDNAQIINILGFITIGYAINIFIKYFSIMKLQNKCSESLHNNMITSLTRSKVSYFDRTPSGRLINRFSTDLGISFYFFTIIIIITHINITLQKVVVDQSLPLTSIDAVEVIISHISLLMMIVFINPYFLIVAVSQLIILYFFAKISKSCLIESKQTDLRNRSPVFNYFSSTVQGVLPIRVYNQIGIFQSKFDVLSDNSLRSSYVYWLNQRAFGFYVHLLSSISGIIGIFMLIGVNKSGSDIGESIVYFLSMSDCIQWGLRQIIQTDVTMSSTQRILNICKLESEASPKTSYDETILKQSLSALPEGKTTANQQDKIQFPSKGSVEFTNVRMKYREGLDPVLNNLSFKIEPGTKVGCIGRTGAGKSSIIQALFRMTEIDETSNDNKTEEMAIKIDGHNTKNIGLSTLRGGISIIPQTPFMFKGTILKNLDPLNEYTEDQVNNAIQEIGLKNKIQTLPNGIHTEISSSSELFSVGQKQLICLGRAILKKSKLLVLDEATANIDMQTDNFIQNKIKENFKDSTVITVAHRLNTIADYDKIIVLDKGKVIESGDPYILMKQDTSIFKNMVTHTGKQNSKSIFEIARSSYQLRSFQTQILDKKESES